MAAGSVSMSRGAGVGLEPEAGLVVARMLRQQIHCVEADPETFRLAVNYQREVAAWFDRTAGWRFEVYRSEGVCRLYKRRHDPPGDRAPVVQRSKSSTAASPLVLVLASLVCEQLWRGTQATFNDLQRAVVQACGTEADAGRLPRFRPAAAAGEKLATAASHRLAFINALRLLESWHVIASDVALDLLEHDQGLDLVITARRERLALLIASVAPSLLDIDLDAPHTHVDALCADQRELPEDAPAKAHERRRRHLAMRAVLDDPGLTPDPDTEVGRYLSSYTGRERALDAAAVAGLACTVRRDWWTVADPQGHTTDLTFPHGRTLEQQGALLLLDVLAGRDDPMGWFGIEWACAELRRVLAERPWWARRYQGINGDRSLAEAAIGQLLSAGIVAADPPPGSGWRPTPALHLWQVHISHAANAVQDTAGADGAAEQENQ
ncbi:TIGR02678 family protein (plasmid) [Streptomyces viridifaciens]|nr:TIGR02678 family protein [Streptomyces viridifaciens]